MILPSISAERPAVTYSVYELFITSRALSFTKFESRHGTPTSADNSHLIQHHSTQTSLPKHLKNSGKRNLFIQKINNHQTTPIIITTPVPLGPETHGLHPPTPASAISSPNVKLPDTPEPVLSVYPIGCLPVPPSNHHPPLFFLLLIE